MRQEMNEFQFQTTGPGARDITAEILLWVRESGIRDGLLTLHIQHTSASLVVQENADPQVLDDMEAFLRRLVPPGDRIFRHTAEGADDMPAHMRSALTTTSLSLPVNNGAPALGIWQAIYLYEHRDMPHRRSIAAHLLGQ
jgi:secondary thiamine-phosphate synthase enzyme